MKMKACLLQGNVVVRLDLNIALPYSSDSVECVGACKCGCFFFFTSTKLLLKYHE